MLRDKPLSHLILILFTTMIGANILGEMLRFILIAIVGPDTIVELALLRYVEYSIGPHMFNLIILSFSFELALKFNLITMLGPLRRLVTTSATAIEHIFRELEPCSVWATGKYSSSSVVILLIFGAKRIPEMAQGLGKGIREFRTAMRDVQDEIEAPKQPTQPTAPPAQTEPQSKDKDQAEIEPQSKDKDQAAS